MFTFKANDICSWEDGEWAQLRRGFDWSTVCPNRPLSANRKPPPEPPTNLIGGPTGITSGKRPFKQTNNPPPDLHNLAEGGVPRPPHLDPSKMEEEETRLNITTKDEFDYKLKKTFKNQYFVTKTQKNNKDKE